MRTFAVIETKTGFIVNRIALDDVSDWPVPDGHLIIEETSQSFDIGGAFKDGVYSPPPREPDPEVDLLSYASMKRWEREVGGIVVLGVPVSTDDRSKMMVMGARIAAESDPGWSTMWVGADGRVYPIDAARMILISEGIANHVNACFAQFALIKAKIEAGAITSVLQIDAAYSG